MRHGSPRRDRDDRERQASGGRGRSPQSDDRWGRKRRKRSRSSDRVHHSSHHSSPQRGSPRRDARASRAGREKCSPEPRWEKRSRSRDGRSPRSSTSPSPSPKKRKKDKRKKDKKKKRHKDKRQKRRKERNRRSRSASVSSGDEDVDDSTRATASPSKHRSGVTVVESPRVDNTMGTRRLGDVVDAPACVQNGSRSGLAARPRSYGAKVMAAADQKRLDAGSNAGKRTAVQADQQQNPETEATPRHDQQLDRPDTLRTDRPNGTAKSATAATASQVFANLVPRSMRRSSGTSRKQDTSHRTRDRPTIPVKVKHSSSSAASEGLPSSALPEPVAARRVGHETAGTSKLPQQSVSAPQAQLADSSSKGCVMCCECEDQPADVHCIQCDESFCRPCWGGQHRRGKRSTHNLQPILGDLLDRAEQPAEPSLRHEDPPGDAQLHHCGMVNETETEGDSTQNLGAAGSIGPALPPGGMAALYSNDSERRLKSNREKVRWLPLRLTDEERTLLSFLQGALHRSDYTDKVDVFSHSDKVQRQLHGMREYMQTQCGLQLANSFKAGQRLVRSKLRENEEFFARAFEVGRRYKVMNPQKMPSEYGKMMYLLMDSRRPDVAETLKINLVRPIQTVGQLLQAKRGEAILASEDLEDATRDLSDDIHERSQLKILQQQKREAVGRILDKYSSSDLTRDDIMRVLDSISDANNFLANNERPVTRVMELLKTNFDTKGPKGNVKGGDFSLAIGRGNNFRSGGGFYGAHKKYMVHSMGGSSSGGAKLTHSHSTQFAFTSQTFMLWQQISKHMYKLWIKADNDMLNNPYRLQNTGQGLNRVQQCPQVSNEMHRILHYVQKRCGGHWVGLSVIHLGDRDVPNALTFIDKYTQVPRILAPIVSCVEQLDSLSASRNTAQYIRLNGGASRIRMQILSDFFKHGFDGSGDDGGSCIDGRLTSAWNWCSKVEKKRYYNIFLLAGFRSFN